MTTPNPHIPPRRSGTARILHTSDWHLGVQVRNESRGADHDALIDELVTIAAEAQPDLILHTGDLFDGHRPPMADLERAIRALRRLAEIAPVSLLAGNHDSVGTLRMVATAVEDGLEQQLADGTWNPYGPCAQRIRVHHSLTPPQRGLICTYAGSHGVDVRLACLPFVNANRTLTDFDKALEARTTYADDMGRLIDVLTKRASEQLDPSRQVMVFASHLHIGGADLSTEKKLHVSDTYAADGARIPSVYSYIALGHIHRPQVVNGGRGHYGGSLLEVDFGEKGEAKRVLLADCEPGRPAEVVSVPLHAGRRLQQVSTTLEELAAIAPDLAGCIVEVTIVAGAGDAAAAGASSALSEPQSLDVTVRSLLAGADVVQVIDARRRRVVREAEKSGAAPTGAPPTLEEELRTWLGSAGAKRLADGADVARVVSLFAVLDAAEKSGEPLALPGLAELAELCGDL